MRLIDADKLIELCNIMADKSDGMGKSIWEQFATTVEWSPTVDAEPVVRCKDCKDWTTWNDPTETQSNYCPILDYWTKGEFYCAYGERREDDQSKT